jgi:hypothetical protein
MSVNLTGTVNATTGNLINTISSAGAITGITTGAGNDNIYANTINTLSTTGAAAVTAIAVTAGTTKNIYKNRIYNISGSNASSTVNGILVSGGTTVTVYNNLIGDLRATAASAADPVRGISVTSATVSSTINVYYNTVYLNASSTGTNFGTTGIYHVTSATATTATLNLRNNSITNTSTPRGTGITVAYRRSTTTLTNYAATSNNNLFYAGTAGATKLIFYDGTNSDQTITTFQVRVATRDALSVTENLTAKFLSTTGSSPVFLHMDATIASLVESGAVNIAGFTDDIDGQIRAGNTGYTGSSSSPDIGADEIFGVETVPPVITYTLLNDTTSTANRNVAGVSITDASGINITAGTKPRIYYKRSADANVWLDNTASTNGWKYTEATNSSSPFSFTIDYSLLYGGATVTAGVIQYFIVAQDIATTANIAINSGTFAATPASVALTPTAFPIGVIINSYNIPFSGTYNVGATEIFTSLTKAGGLFASINSAGLMGNTIFNVTSDLSEDGANALNQWTESGAGNYTLTIQPDAATARTVSGNAATGLIRLNGADRVRIDGSNAGSGTYLSFKNTNTAGTTGTAFTFTNGATNNTIRYSDAEAYANATNGVIFFGPSASAGGNSNNRIDNCTLNATVAANTGNAVIYSAGTTGNENSTDTISNNIISGYRDRGLDITATGSTAWIISGNSFNNGSVTGAINYAASSALHGIRVLGGSGYGILNNYIGGNGTLASGGNSVYSSTAGNISYQGILLSTTAATPASDIKGNTIAAITISSVPAAASSYVFTGIETNGSGINIGGATAGDGNTIGSNSSNGSIAITTSTVAATNTSLIAGINCGSSNGLIIGNQVSGIDISNIGSAPAPSSFLGLYVNSTVAPAQVNNNIIGSAGTNAVSNSIQVLPSSASLTASLNGIVTGTAVSTPIQINGNTIQNISNLSSSSSGSFIGINNAAVSSGAVITITNNTIQYIGTTANPSVNSTIYTGISASSPSIINNDTINHFIMNTTGTAAQLRGISVSGAFAYSISGNLLSNLSTASTNVADIETGTPSTYNITGILNAASVAGQEISNNILSNFSSTTANATNTAVTGIGVTTTGAAGNIFNNRISAFVNTATGASPGISGIMAVNGSFNVYNNAIKFNNAGNTNGIKIYGINHAAGSNWNYFHNSVSISGSGTGAARSAAFIRAVAGNLLLRNNVFINTRTGSGSNYALSNLTSPASANWSSTTSDYNDLYSSNANTTAEWGNGISQTFAQWQTASGSGAHSVNSAVSFVSSVYDLQPDSASNCALNNGGTPITSPVIINTDINNASRSAISPDIGAYEFNYAAFTVTAGNSSPVCSGSTVDLSVQPGSAINPVYSWRNPANAVISIIQNPTVAATAGTFAITVTDVNGCFVSANTTVLLNQRPTASMTGATAVCEGGAVNLLLAVTGTGAFSGALSDGTNFSGTAPTITVPVSPITTTAFYIVSLDDSSCSSIQADIPDTITVAVTHSGDWLGITGTNWNDAANWCGGVPVATTNVTIPGGLSNYPIISTGTNALNNITIESGASLTVNGAVLQIGGTIIKNGAFDASNGTIEMNGSAAQAIPPAIFAGNVIRNLTTNNNAGVTLGGTLHLTGILLASAGQFNTGGFLTLMSTATQTALIDGNGAGNVSGNVTLQRYLASGFGYKYVSSAFVAATVNEFSNDLDLTAAFPSFYSFDENLLTAGWVNYTNSSGLLNPGEGYAGNFGSSSAPKTIDITGVVNNGTVSSVLYNHNRTYTQGFHLVGNPYPSPVDWDATSGWIKTNIDNALYYFNASTTDQYGGTYSSYINGVSSDGIASNIISSTQGFFVHVTNGSYPVLGQLSFNNSVRVNNLAPVFHSFAGQMLRISAGFADDQTISDAAVVYFDNRALKPFDKKYDALKLMNTNPDVPSLYAISADTARISVRAMTYPQDSITVQKLGLKTEKPGWVTFTARDIQNISQSLHIYLFDAKTNSYQDLRQHGRYRLYLASGNYENRFSIVFSLSELPSNTATVNNETFNAYSSGGMLFVNCTLPAGERASMAVSNMLGQMVYKQEISGNGSHQINTNFMAGVYVVSLYSNKEVHSKKVLIEK